MNSVRFNQYALKAGLALMRFGVGNIAVCVVCLTGGVAWLALPQLQAQAASRRHALDQTQHALLAADRSAPAAQRQESEERMAHFYNVLGRKDSTGQQIKTMFDIARETGLTISRAEYKSEFDKNSGVHAYHVVLPVKGPYGAIRRFCKKMLLAMPFASLDEMSFKRDAITNATLEANLRFTLYLIDRPAPAKANKAPPAEKVQS